MGSLPASDCSAELPAGREVHEVLAVGSDPRRRDGAGVRITRMDRASVGTVGVLDADETEVDSGVGGVGWWTAVAIRWGREMVRHVEPGAFRRHPFLVNPRS
jgi:hypothetical protein